MVNRPDYVAWAGEQLQESIVRYHLDHRLIVSAREIVWKNVQRLIDETDKLMNSAVKGPMNKDDIERKMKELRAFTKAQAELSATAGSFEFSSSDNASGVT